MTARKILIPYNFSAHDEKSLDYVIERFSSEKDVEVTLFNAYTPVPQIDTQKDPIMRKMDENLAYLQHNVYGHETKLDEAAQRLVKSGFPGDKVHCVFTPRKKDMGQEIIDMAHKLNADTVVLSRSPRKITRFFTKSNSEKVMRELEQEDVFIVN